MRYRNLPLAIILSILILFVYRQIGLAQTVRGANNLILDLEEITITPSPTPVAAQTEKKTPTEQPDYLALSIPSSFISYGYIVPGEPIIREQGLTVRAKHLLGYTVNIIQNHPLLTQDGESIPDTTCDNGSCTHTIAQLWQNPLTFGFGMRCEKSSECSPDMQISGMFRHIPSSSEQEQPVSFLSSKLPLTTFSVLYKLNISPSLPNKQYSNSITYLLMPQL